MQTMRPWIERFTSRKYLTAIAAIILIILNDILGYPVDQETYKYLVGIVIAWITGESLIDMKHK